MMEYQSVSKGAFPKVPRVVGKKRNAAQTTRKIKNCEYKDEPWYKTFKKTWLAIEDAANEINTNAFRQILTDMENFVTKVKNFPLLSDEIPTGILLAGVNIPDHGILLQKLVEKLESVTPYIATVWARDANTLKNLNEEMIYQIINNIAGDESNNGTEIKKTQCTFYKLHAWHEENNNGDTPIVIVIPDFESFSPKIIHDFILILSSYSKTIKFVLIFGVATTLHIVHRSLSYDATSKLKIQVFQTQTQFQSLSDVFNGIVLSPKIPFKLIGKAFKFLVDSFLYYDFSVKGFLQSYKVCVWRHFYQRNEKLICCCEDDVDKFLSSLETADIRNLKKLKSIEKYYCLDKKYKVSDAEFKESLPDLLYEFHKYMDNFLILLKCLFQLSINLPNNPFGKNFREIYATAVGNISIFEIDEYKTAMKLIGFLPKEELITNINLMLKILNEHESVPMEIVKKLNEQMSTIKDASLEIIENTIPEVTLSTPKNRTKLLLTLKKRSEIHSRSPYKQALSDFVEYLDKEVFRKYLITPKQVPLYEVFCYDDLNDATAFTMRDHIKGSMKATIHTGLNDPFYYFGCECCNSDTKLLPTHPDISIVYKLYTEAGKMINLYDWLQSFLVTLNPNDTEDRDEQDVDPKLQARFTQAIAELQFLGFIKPTRKKADHVKKLT